MYSCCRVAEREARVDSERDFHPSSFLAPWGAARGGLEVYCAKPTRVHACGCGLVEVLTGARWSIVEAVGGLIWAWGVFSSLLVCVRAGWGCSFGFRQILGRCFTDFGLAYGKHFRWVGVSPKYME